MGNSLNQYRASIGLFHNVRVKHLACSSVCYKVIITALYCLIMFLNCHFAVGIANFLLLLLCGDVELNPGPPIGDNRQNVVPFYCLSRCKSFMSVSLIVFLTVLLILLCGDVSLNPGPSNVSTQNFSFCHLNARSLVSGPDKLDEIRLLIDKFNYYVIAVTESWLDDSVENDQIDIDGFTVYRVDRNRHGGGVLLYVSNLVNSSVFIEYSADAQLLWVKLHLCEGMFIFGVGYVPPGLNTVNSDVLINVLQDHFDTINNLHHQAVVLTGDFNALCSEWWYGNPDNIFGRKLCNFVKANNLSQLINEPTRVTATTSSLLDLIVTDAPLKVLNSGVSSRVANCDHCLIYAEMSFAMQNGSYYKAYFNFRDVNWDSLNVSLANADWMSCYNEIDPQVCADKWTRLFESIFETHVPKVVRKIRFRDKSWFNKTLKHLVSVKHRLFRKARGSSSQNDWNKYKRAAEACTVAIRKAKEDHNQSLYDSLANPNTCSKAWWRITKGFMKNKNNDDYISSLGDNFGHIAQTPEDICNMFNKYFADQSKIDDEGKEPPLLPLRTNSTLGIPNITEGEVSKLLCSLDSSKAPGPDGIPNHSLKIIGNALTPPFTNFINFCLQKSIFPRRWKKANVLPLFKKGDRSKVNNYRPVSLLPSLSKVFEK